MEIESWKTYNKDCRYLISDLGRIKKLNKDKRCLPFKILKPWKDKYGYLHIRINNKRFAIHKLVLEAFVGLCPPGMECRHLDGNPGKNKLENLKWGTHSENMQDSIRHNTFRNSSGCNNPSVKLNELQVRIIKRLLKDGYLTHKEIGKIFNVTRKTIDNIDNNKTWRYLNV